jgi:thermostable 8-oxoguanine DNA glycosylase
MYCVVDFRGWRVMFDEERREFDIPAYLRYLAKIRDLSQKLGWSVQETDLAVWEYDRQHNK